jgi:hypothetical protein
MNAKKARTANATPTPTPALAPVGKPVSSGTAVLSEVTVFERLDVEEDAVAEVFERLDVKGDAVVEELDTVVLVSYLADHVVGISAASTSYSHVMVLPSCDGVKNRWQINLSAEFWFAACHVGSTSSGGMAFETRGSEVPPIESTRVTMIPLTTTTPFLTCWIRGRLQKTSMTDGRCYSRRPV